MTSFSPDTLHWSVRADSTATFELELPIASDTKVVWNVTVGGVPTAWVSTVIRQNRVFVTLTIPAHTPAYLYPLSLTFSAVDTPAKRYVVRHTVEITPAVPQSPLHRLRRHLGWRWIAFGGVALIVVTLLFRWIAAPSVLVESAYDSQPKWFDVAAEPLALVPVEIQAQWQESLPLPPILPTPTLIPTPTPLPPLPTPLPPPTPAPVENARGLEMESVHGEYTYERMFQEVGDQFGVDWRLLASIAYRESGLAPDAVGGSGEEGMMQIMPDTWNEFAPRVGESDPFSPYASARVAAYYLTYLRDYLNSQGYTEPYWLLVAYNWGPNNLRQHLASGGDWGGIPTMRQNYAYSIIDVVNNDQSPLWASDVKEVVP